VFSLLEALAQIEALGLLLVLHSIRSPALLEALHEDNHFATITILKTLSIYHFPTITILKMLSSLGGAIIEALALIYSPNPNPNRSPRASIGSFLGAKP
jgi:hypothetical protein